MYEKEVKEKWGNTLAYKEYIQKNNGKHINNDGELEAIFMDFSEVLDKGLGFDTKEALNLVKRLKYHITDAYYTCTNEILISLGSMYVMDERFKNNIDKYGSGTAEFVNEAIKVYCELVK